MKTFIISLFTCIFCLSITTATAQNSVDQSVTELTETWDGLLKNYVNDAGKVNYEAWQENDADTVQAIVDELTTTNPANLTNEQQQLAFWINSYNILAIHEVLNRYPVDTIRPTFLLIPERSFFTEEKHVVNGQSLSLDKLENEIIRAEFNEPLIHFGIVCASTSCPNLRNEAYRGDKLISQLEEEARAFLADPTKNVLEGNSVKISKIFDWFKDDFIEGFGNVANFLIAYGPTNTVECEDMDCSSLNIGYLDYDWSLNKQ